MHDVDRGADGRVMRRSLRKPEAFATIFERHFDAVFGYARRRVGPELAEEIVTDTFTTAFDRRPQLRSRPRFGYPQGTLIGQASYLEQSVVGSVPSSVTG